MSFGVAVQKVGIRELKSKLSEYVRKANAGEIFQVTERGRVVAQLRAPGPISEEYPYPLLLKAAAEGQVRLARGPAPADLYAPRAGIAIELLDELRGDH